MSRGPGAHVYLYTSRLCDFDRDTLQTAAVTAAVSTAFALPRVHAPWKKKFIANRKGKVKVKFSHTRYRALGLELIPVYRQSARR